MNDDSVPLSFQFSMFLCILTLKFKVCLASLVLLILPCATFMNLLCLVALFSLHFVLRPSKLVCRPLSAFFFFIFSTTIPAYRIFFLSCFFVF